MEADLAASWTPNEIAGRLRLEATDPTVERMANSPDARGRTVSGEAIYQYIYAIPKGELARKGIFLQSKRTKRRPRTTGRTRGGPIVGMVPIAERGEDAAQRRVPGHWEGDLIIGKNGTSCAATLVERMSGFTGLLALPSKHAEPTADAVIEFFNDLPEMMKASLAWDQGSEMAQHAKVSLATAMPVYFADPHSPWQRPSNENTNRLYREYLPKGTVIPDHQPYLTTIAEEINNRPRRRLGYLTPTEAFARLLAGGSRDASMNARPGFISVTLLASADKTRVLNVAQWESADDVKATQSDPEAAEYAKKTAGIAKASPGLYQVVGEYK